MENIIQHIQELLSVPEFLIDQCNFIPVYIKEALIDCINFIKSLTFYGENCNTEYMENK